jgi:hypothetical protein
VPYPPARIESAVSRTLNDYGEEMIILPVAFSYYDKATNALKGIRLKTCCLHAWRWVAMHSAGLSGVALLFVNFKSFFEELLIAATNRRYGNTNALRLSLHSFPLATRRISWRRLQQARIANLWCWRKFSRGMVVDEK